jgi:hypothetical protein
VWKNKKRFFHTSLQNAWGVLHSSHRLGGGQTTNNKTGQIICYKNRTFLFATDMKFVIGPRAAQAR